MSIAPEVEIIYNTKFKHLVEAGDTQDVDIVKSHKQIRSNLSSQLSSPADIWIFGYGSLIWKVDFPCINWQRGYITGFIRRFYQHSIDHRGTKVKPGRVVTLLPGQPNDRVYGIAYRVAASDKDEVLKHLDFREQNGYQRCTVPFHIFPEESRQKDINIVIYIATAENESWAGRADESKIDVIATQIFTSAGPSGRNRDYLFNLNLAMSTLFPGVHDEHLLSLVAAITARIEKDEVRLLEKAIKSEIHHSFQYIQQETLKENHGSNVSTSLLDARIEHLLKFCSKIGWREYFLTKELYGIHSLNLWGDEKCRQS